MTPITHITPREQALQRENERLTDQVKRQSATIHVQAVAIQAMQVEIAASERNLEQLTDELAQSREEIAELKNDALRYRWWCAALESADLDYLEDVFKCIPQNAPIKKQDLDAAIDAATKEQP